MGKCGEAVLTYFPEHHSDLKSLVSDSDLVFVGTLVGSRADVAETKMIDESGIEEQTILVWDSLEFAVERVLEGAVEGETVSIGHPVFIRYPEGLARLAPDPIDELRSELQAKAGSVGLLSHVTPDNGFVTTIDDLDAHLNGGVPLPKPRAVDVTQEELERLHVPSGELLVEPQPGPDPVSPCEGLTGTALAEAEQSHRC